MISLECSWELDWRMLFSTVLALSVFSNTTKPWLRDTLTVFPLFFCILYCWCVAKAAKVCSQPWLSSWKQSCPIAPLLLWTVHKSRLGWKRLCLLRHQVTSCTFPERLVSIRYQKSYLLLLLKDVMGCWTGDSFSSYIVLWVWRISHCKGCFRFAILHKESGALS